MVSPLEQRETSSSGRPFGRPLNSRLCYQPAHKGSRKLGDGDFEFKSGSVATLSFDLE